MLFPARSCKPLIGYCLCQSIHVLSDSIARFDEFCARGIEVNASRATELLNRSLMLVTALSPHIGYDKVFRFHYCVHSPPIQAAEIARRAHLTGSTLREAALALGYVSAEQFDAWVKPENMVGLAIEKR